MNQDLTTKIRSIGIIAHINAGKTTTTERILYISGKNRYIGSVDEGTTCTDYLTSERERGITIVSSAVTCNWQSHKLHIIDTPGHVDFTAEVERSLRVLDGAIILLCGVNGIQTQTETVWRQADKHHIPRLIYINKLDRVGANYKNVLSDLQTRFECNCVIMNVPYYQNEQLVGLIDIFEKKLLFFDKNGKISQKCDIPIEMQTETNKILDNNLDILTMLDDSLLESVLDGSYTKQMIDEIIKYGTNMQKLLPVYCGSSNQNIGVVQLLDGVVSYLPSPTEAPNQQHFGEANVAYIFKIQHIKGVGQIALARVYSGSIQSGQIMYNLRTGESIVISSIKNVYADMFEDIDIAISGEIVAIEGLTDIATGDTIASDCKTHPLESINFSHPVMQVRVEPTSVDDLDKLQNAVRTIANEDASIEIKNDTETGAILLCGMGELHIDIILEQLRQQYKLSINSGSPYVTYTTTVSQKCNIDYTFDYRTVDGAQQISISLTATPHSTQEFDECNILISQQNLPTEISQAIINGLQNAINIGIDNCSILGCDFEITKLTYSQQPAPLIVETAISNCAKKLLTQNKTDILEPIMQITVETPTDTTGLILGDLKSKNAQILDISYKITFDQITALVSLKELLGYSTHLRNQTQGRGNFSMEFCKYNVTQ